MIRNKEWSGSLGGGGHSLIIPPREDRWRVVVEEEVEVVEGLAPVYVAGNKKIKARWQAAGGGVTGSVPTCRPTDAPLPATALRYTGTHRDTSGHTGTHRDTSGHTGTHRDTPLDTSESTDTLVHVLGRRCARCSTFLFFSASVQQEDALR